MDTIIGRIDWSVVGFFGGLLLSIFAIWLWKWWQDNKIKSSKPVTAKEIDLIKGMDTPERSRKLTLEQYVRNLESAIADISTKTKSIKDEEQRNTWREYVQELRNRQLTVIQEIQDKEWRKVQHKSLTREEMREVEKVALCEIDRLEKGSTHDMDRDFLKRYGVCSDVNCALCRRRERIL